jgi:hypothetical protein
MGVIKATHTTLKVFFDYWDHHGIWDRIIHFFFLVIKAFDEGAQVFFLYLLAAIVIPFLLGRFYDLLFWHDAKKRDERAAIQHSRMIERRLMEVQAPKYLLQYWLRYEKGKRLGSGQLKALAKGLNRYGISAEKVGDRLMIGR